ncbi:MAG TPA: tetratricopeptide repeat protein, partial [Pyrinomonadaceae bacterium]
LLCSEGKTEPAQALASEAIDLARQERMENVATGGLIDLANSFTSREDYITAEHHLRQALEFAHQNEGRRNEARAALALASLKLAVHKADEALDFTERALPFFEQGGYSREVSQAYVIRGFASNMKGDLLQAVQAFEKASQIGEVSQRALASTGLGTVLSDQEQHPKALQYFEQSNKLYESIGNSYYTAFSKHNVAASLAELGRLQEAKQTIADAEKVLLDLKISQPNLQAKFALLKAKVALGEGRPLEVSQMIKQVTVSDDLEVEAEIYRVMALSQAFAKPHSSDAVRTALKALQIAERSEKAKEVNRSKLTLAEVYFITGNQKDAMTTALELNDYFAAAGQKESGWRAWFVAAKSADGDAAREYLSSATQLLSELKKDWGDDHFQTYSARADIKFYLGPGEVN